MRELKFRIYDKSTEKFRYSGSTLMMLHSFFKATAVLNTRDEQEYQQYAGRKDKHGVEIYEGDRVEQDRNDSFPQYNTGEIVYDDNRVRYLIRYFKKIPKNSFLRELGKSGNVITDTTGDYLYGECGHWPVKVIGNIHSVETK